MNINSLSILHDKFRSVIKSHVYLNVKNGNLETTKTKARQLDQVFQKAQEQIEKDLDQTDDREMQIGILQTLQQDEKELYLDCYLKKTSKSWLRWFLKGCAKYIPQQFKPILQRLQPILPRCFFKPYAKEEMDTKLAHDKFQNVISDKIKGLEKQIEEDYASFEHSLNTLQAAVHALDSFIVKTLNLKEFKDHLKTCGREVDNLIKKCPSIDHKKLGLGEERFTQFKDSHTEINTAIDNNDNAALQKILGPTTLWRDAFIQATKCLTMGVRKLGTQTCLEVRNAESKQVNENALHDFRGYLSINATPNIVSALNELQRLMLTHANCRPGSLDIKLTNDQITPEFLDILLAIKSDIPEISIKELTKLDLREHADKGEKFATFLKTMHFPDLKELIFSKNIDADCISKEKFFPTLERLDLTECNKNISDEQLTAMIENGYLNSIGSLIIGEGLTTDSIKNLMKLPKLTKLNLVNVQKGTSELKPLKNPLQVKSFYTASAATRPMARNLYSGPYIWAAAFQIPLARAGVDQVFGDNHKTLDPKSVAYWLHQDDYTLLQQPQTPITTIIADYNVGLNDENIVAFVKKFPNTTSLSCYGCPNITNKGINDLLKACPKLNIDLSGCPKIEGAAFENDKRIIYKDYVFKVTDDQLIDEESLNHILSNTNLSELTGIDLSGCTELTNKMLGQLLDHFNEDIWIDDGQTIINPQRLNLAVLNLTGCSSITHGAFQNGKDNGKFNHKIIENLSRVVINGTKVNEDILKGLYPYITFQDLDEPLTIQIDPNDQLANYHKELSPEMKLHHRFVLELFPDSCQDTKKLEEVLSEKLDTTAPEFSNFMLSLQATQETEAPSFAIPRDLLYCQFPYFRDRLRPGGYLWKSSSFDLINIHFMGAASSFIESFLKGKEKKLPDWRTAADIAEIVGPRILNLSSLYQRLLDHIHDRFSLDDFDDLCATAMALEDEQACDVYSNALQQMFDLGELDAETLAFKQSALEAMKTQIIKMHDKAPQVSLN